MTQSETADARLQALYQREWAWRQREFAGADDEDHVAEPADHLPAVDAQTQAERATWWRQALVELQSITRDDLSDAEKLNAQVFEAQLRELLEDQDVRSYELPFNSDTAFWSNLGFTARKPFATTRDVECYLGILSDIPRYFTEHSEHMRAGLRRGFSLPQVVMAGPLSSLDAVLKPGPIEDHLFHTPFRNMPTHIDAVQARTWQRQAQALIESSVLPAWRELSRFMRDEYTPAARKTIAARDLPEGEAYYRHCIRKYVTADLSPELIHERGLAEVEALEVQMREAMVEAEFHGTRAEFFLFFAATRAFMRAARMNS